MTIRQTAKRALTGALLVCNALLVAKSLIELLNGADAFDWHTLTEAADRIQAGSQLYDLSPDYLFRWSPVAAWIMVAVAPLGVLGWQILHGVSLLLLRDARLILATFFSWPFWADLGNGNSVTFLFVASALALRGSRIATIALFILVALSPRPLAFPVVGYLLWRRREARLPFATVVLLHLALAASTGWLLEWIQVLAGSGLELNNVYNLAPSRWLGMAWIIAGLTIAVWLTSRQRLGWASLAASPYLFPQYLMMGLLELNTPQPDPPRQTSRGRHE